MLSIHITSYIDFFSSSGAYYFSQLKQLNHGDYAEVQEAMWEARSQWFKIGVRFHLDIHELNVIDMDNSGDVDKKFHKMLDAWFRNGKNRTWKAICDVLRHNTVSMANLAEKVWAKFAKAPPTHTEGKTFTAIIYSCQ